MIPINRRGLVEEFEGDGVILAISEDTEPVSIEFYIDGLKRLEHKLERRMIRGNKPDDAA